MAIPLVIFLYPQNTQVLFLQGLMDSTTSTYLNSASVTATLLDQRGNADPVLNGITLNYVVASNGNYQGTVPASFDPAAFTAAMNQLSGYQLQIEATQNGVQALWTIPVIIKLRTQ